MPAKTEHLEVSNCGRMAIAVATATSSGKTSRSGLVAPVGWQETESAALCRTPGIWTIWNQ